MTGVHRYPIDGAVHRVGATETAFANRTMKFAPVIAAIWQDPAENEANIAWVREYAAALRPPFGAGRLHQFHGQR